MPPTKLKFYFPRTVKTHSPCITICCPSFIVYVETRSNRNCNSPVWTFPIYNLRAQWKGSKTRCPSISIQPCKTGMKSPVQLANSFCTILGRRKTMPCYLKRFLTLWWEISCAVYADYSRRRKKKFSVKREKSIHRCTVFLRGHYFILAVYLKSGL